MFLGLRVCLAFLCLPFACLGFKLNSAPPDTLLFAIITDTHIGKAGNDTGLAAIVADINKNPDINFVIHTGDVSDFGTDDQLKQAKSLLDKLNKPYYIVPGNHDTGWSGSGGLVYNKLWQKQKFTTEEQGVRFIGVSTGPYGRMSRGYVPQDQLRWLDSLIKVIPKEQPVVFISHYPLDANLSNSGEVLDKLRQLHTLAIFCGHGHTNKVFDFGGITGIMSRTAQVRQGTLAYNKVYLTRDSLQVRMVNPGKTTDTLWAALPVSGGNLKSMGLPEPQDNFAINQENQKVQPAWIYQDEGNIVSTPAVWKNNVLVGNLLGTFKSLNTRKNKVNWQFKAGQAIYSSPAVTGNKVVFGSADSTIYCLNIRNGKIIWQVKTGAPVLASPVIQNGQVYMGSSDLKFRAINLKTGKVTWTYAGLAGFPASKPAVANGKIVFGTWNKTLYALNSQNGSLAWQWRNNEYSHYYSPAMCVPVIQQNKVYIVAPDEKLRQLDLATGHETYQTSEFRVRESLGGDAQNNWLVAKTMQDSVIVWHTKNERPEVLLRLSGNYGQDFSPSMPVFQRETAYFGTTYGRVYAVDIKQKKIKWRYQVSNDMVNTPQPLGKDKIVVTSVDGKVTVLTERE